MDRGLYLRWPCHIICCFETVATALTSLYVETTWLSRADVMGSCMWVEYASKNVVFSILLTFFAVDRMWLSTAHAAEFVYFRKLRRDSHRFESLSVWNSTYRLWFWDEAIVERINDGRLYVSRPWYNNHISEHWAGSKELTHFDFKMMWWTGSSDGRWSVKRP
jgi:hypothetical protein